MVRAASALCGAADAFVALGERAPRVVGAELASVGVASQGRGRSADGRRLVRVAASGVFLDSSEPLRATSGLWDLVWQSGVPASEDDGGVARFGAPVYVAGALAGLIGVSLPAGSAPDEGWAAELATLADIGGAALERLGGLAG